LECRVFYRHRIIEDHHYAIASKSLKRAAVFEDDLADSRMIRYLEPSGAVIRPVRRMQRDTPRRAKGA
jgi:hypothetical protein